MENKDSSMFIIDWVENKNQVLFSKIEDVDLFFEQNLIDYMGSSILFLCKGEDQYYLSALVDSLNRKYIVVQLSLLDTFNLLHSAISIRDVILKQKEYWEIVRGDKICLDAVTKKRINELDPSLLPQAGICFRALTKEAKTHLKMFDLEYCWRYVGGED